MDSHTVMRLLIYSAIFNYIVLCVWFVVFIAARDAMYGLHSKWFRLPRESFDAMHYAGMSVYKIGILLLNVAPAVAIYFARVA